jgi:NADPH-dependent 7-cyano-7-deazaguanine reductase QueF
MVPVSTKKELLRSGLLPHTPRTSSLTVHVTRARFLRSGRVESGAFDPGVLRISFRPARLLLDWTVLNEYLDSFKGEPGSAEAAVAAIASDLQEVLAPAFLQVTMDLNMDGSGGFVYEVTTV